jgi:SulP family sulfate permease
MNFKNILPVLGWLPNYKKAWLKGDLGAGLTVGVMLIPQGIAYAMIAGLPPIYGLYTAMIPQIVYAIFGTSRQLSVGPVAMDSLIVASGVGAIAAVGSEYFIFLAILLALIMGAIQVLFGIFRMGFLVNFLSKPVISGFTSAAALIIALNQLKYLFGVNMPRSNQLQVILYEAFKQINNINWPSFVIGSIGIVLIVFLKKKYKKIPGSLVAVVFGVLAVKIFQLEQYGVSILGEIPQGLPSFKVPQLNREILEQLAPLGLTLALIGFLEAISVAKSIEAKHNDYKVDANKELIALGLGNMVGAFFQSYPSTGGFSRTAVNNSTGAKTPLASIFSALVVAFTLLCLTPLFFYLPKAIIASIIIVAVFGLLDFKVPNQLWKYTKRDLIILNATLIITATVGIKEGIMTGVILSLVMLIYKSSKPHVAILGRVPETKMYRNIKRFDDLEVLDHILVIRFDAQLHFANSAYFKDTLTSESINKGPKLKLVIINGKSLNSLDSSGIYVLKEVIDYFKEKKIKLYFCGLNGPVRDTLYKSEIISEIGEEQCFLKTQDAIDAYEKNKNNEEIDVDKFKYVRQTNS